MDREKLEPEDLFWQQIESRPGDPFPRLLYADWCDENDRPIMAIVQRWLVASNRRSIFDSDWWWWGCEKGGLSVPDSSLLPLPLFAALPFGRESDRLGNPIIAIRYRDARRADEAIEQAWPVATRKKWFRTWVPEFSKVIDAASNRVVQIRPQLAHEQIWTGRWTERWILLLLYLVFVLAGIKGVLQAPQSRLSGEGGPREVEKIQFRPTYFSGEKGSPVSK